MFKVAYGTVHNAYSSLDDNFSMANNFRSLDAALEHGARALMLGDMSASFVCIVYCLFLIRDWAVTIITCYFFLTLLELTLLPGQTPFGQTWCQVSKVWTSLFGRNHF